MYKSDRPQDAVNVQDTTTETTQNRKTYSAIYAHQLRAFIDAAEDVDVDPDVIEDLLEGLEDGEEEEETQESDHDEDGDSEDLALLVREQHTPVENDLDDLEMETAIVKELHREGTCVHLILK
jgi:DNA-binding transcriptional MerR regulator